MEIFAERTFTSHFRADLAVAAIRAGRQRFDKQNPDAQALARAQRRYNLPFSLKSNLRLAGKWGELGAFAQYRAGAPFTPVLGAAPDPATGQPLPQYAPEPNQAALPNYFRADFTASKFIRQKANARTLVLFAALSNVFNTRNVSRYAYSADFSQATPEYFQRRLLYFGLVKTWQ